MKSFNSGGWGEDFGVIQSELKKDLKSPYPPSPTGETSGEHLG